MAHTRAELLVNGRSRKSRGAFNEIIAACQAHGITFDHQHLIKPKHLDQTIEEIKERAPDLLVVGSGDGTISNVVGHLANSHIELGIIPLGTTNNFARSLELPLEIDDAAKVIATGQPRNVDLGHIDDEYFANVAGVGLSAVIAGSVSDNNKRRFGRLAYTLEGVWQLFRSTPFILSVEDKDSNLKFNIETHQAIIANGRYHAGRQIAVDASLTSQELIIFALGGRSKLSFLLATVDFYVGKRKSIRHQSYMIGKNVRLTTSSPQSIELDGEVKCTTPCHASVRPAAIRIRTIT
ncbi:MAG: diacylglycerol kinase catalytic region [Candidatus Saccharibacteria bacterium]|nr:diacylglycerol kinase catalytic region [Candidatus Saccharibacteria bacterium]